MNIWKPLGWFLVACFLFLVIAAPAAQAQFSPLTPELQQEILGLGEQAAAVGLGPRALVNVDLRLFVVRIVRGVLAFVGLIMVAMVLYAGFLYMTAGGGQENIEKARGIISRAVIGVAIILSSYGIATWVNRNIQRAIFEQIFGQVQQCNTSNGLASCCREWHAFLNEPDDDRKSNNYRTWQQCQSREREGIEQSWRTIRGQD